MLRLPKVRADVGLEDLISATQSICEGLDTPTSLSVHLLLKYREWDQIVNKDVSPFDYLDTIEGGSRFFDDSTAVSLLRKVKDLPTNIDTEAVALEKFLMSEVKCHKTNERLRGLLVSQSQIDRDTSKLLFSVAYELKRILGPAPALSDLHFTFGPGASSSCKGTKVTVADKLTESPDITSNGLDFLDSYCETDPGFAACLYDIADVDGPFCVTDKSRISVLNWNTLSFVPKTGKTDRAICIEPTLNSFFQKGLGTAIRKRLYLNGFDLAKQPSINSEYARLGSIDGSYATIDLSAASDSISSQLILEVVPDDWFDLLNAFRSPYTRLPNGKLLENNKFSSMGNGYTFELETALFIAIARATRKLENSEHPIKDFMSYGDDIIVPTSVASSLITNLEKLGFETNIEKTFTQGPFRESCGQDFFMGKNVRPVFFKEIPEDIRSYYSLCNSTRYLSRRHVNYYFNKFNISGDCDNRFEKGWRFLLSRIPKKLRFFGPELFGDQCISAPFISLFNRKNYTQEVKILVSIPKYKSFDAYSEPVVRQICRMPGQTSRVALRKKTNFVKVKRIPYHGSGEVIGHWININ